MSSHEPDMVLEAAQQLRHELAGIRLSPAFAKLYSQHTRLSYGQPGLLSWQSTEARERLHDAMRLTAAALIERQKGSSGWQQSLRRAGEILEWLSHPRLNSQGLPLALLASAVYQLAGYPARATGVLNQAALPNEISRIIRDFLRADFRVAFSHIWNLWEQANSVETLPWHDENQLQTAVDIWIAAETASAIGVICAFFRWGNEPRTQLALEKLSAVADIFLNGEDPYSWLLAKLVSSIAEVYVRTSLRANLSSVVPSQEHTSLETFETYQRLAYSASKALVWPSQLQGIERLSKPGSFALCTPTGSGKTTIAEIAILQSLFDSSNSLPEATSENSPQPLVLYLVPSRALAAEVEAKLHEVLSVSSTNLVRVTGLYGGIDWGPTDAWLTRDERTVLICTYEKAEALLKFIGPLFLNRVSLVIVDEAHRVQYYSGADKLISSESRELRLEALSARLLAHLDQSRARTIALSAVSAGFEEALSNWITGGADSIPVRTSYRSTRQLVGRLECFQNGRMTIHFDLMDGARLQFDGEHGARNPYVPAPFPPCPMSPAWNRGGPEKRVRPHLFWAAIHLASLEHETTSRGVLIAVPQQPGGYAEDLLTLLNRDWAGVALPRFFEEPRDLLKERLWQQCLAACEDYFGEGSREYELLERGVVLHHGRMPGVLARLLVELIEKRIVSLVLATSTLSEGVNLPFDTILIPSLHRGKSALDVAEFRNLVGRAGRPGFGTEGRSLVVLPSEKEAGQTRILRSFRQLLNQLSEDSPVDRQGSSARSPLAFLLSQIQRLWQTVSHSESRDEFLAWLEQVAPATDTQSRGQELELIESVDSLDAILLSAIVEVEQLSQQTIGLVQLEEGLQRIWQRTYARVAASEAAFLQQVFHRRAVSLHTRIYPNPTYRRRLYKTSLPPRSGTQLLAVYNDLLLHLKTGTDYLSWSNDDKFEFIRIIVDRLSSIPQFRLDAEVGRNPVEWSTILRWWLDHQHASAHPNRTEISDWHKYVAENFHYRFNWGLGCIVALAMDDLYQGALRLPALEEWPKTGLPWSVFWVKELIIWGTLDPVAAYLLSRRIWVTRRDAEGAAQGYYQSRVDVEPDELLNASNISRWVQSLQIDVPSRRSVPTWSHKIPAVLLRDFGGSSAQRYRVIPIERDGIIRWFDPAGFPLAESPKFEQWDKSLAHDWDFFLDPVARVVTSEPYLSAS